MSLRVTCNSRKAAQRATKILRALPSPVPQHGYTPHCGHPKGQGTGRLTVRTCRKERSFTQQHSACLTQAAPAAGKGLNAPHTTQPPWPGLPSPHLQSKAHRGLREKYTTQASELGYRPFQDKRLKGYGAVSSLVGMLLGRRGRGVGTREQGGGCGWKRGEPGREEAKGGGVEADGHGSRAEEKQKQNQEAGQRGRGKEDRRGQGETTVRRNAAQTVVWKGFGSSGRGGASHTTPAPTTARGEPASHPVASRAAQAGGSAAPAVATGAWRQDGAALGLAPPRCSQPRSPHCQGPEGEASTGTRIRGAGGFRGATHSPRRAPPLHGSVSRSRPCLGPAHDIPLGSAPKTPSPLPDLSPSRLFAHSGIIHFCNFPDTTNLPPLKGAMVLSQSLRAPTLPCMASSR